LILTLSVLQTFTTPIYSQSSVSPKLAWASQPGVTKYRLQIAADEKFRDIHLDRLVTGNQFKPTDLPPGRYYWRVAPSEAVTGSFIRPMPFQVKRVEDPFVPVSQPGRSGFSGARRVKDARAWLTATGELSRLISVPQINTDSTIVVGVNSSNAVFAVDASTGVTRWINRNPDPSATPYKEMFTPLTLSTGSRHLVVVADANRVRALDSETGREVWSSILAGTATTGVIANLPEAGPKIYLVDQANNTLFIVDGISGRLKKHEKLQRRIDGRPVSMPDVGVLLPSANSIEIRSHDGSFIRSVALKYEMTTSLLPLKTSRGSFLLFGTRNGLSVFDSTVTREVARFPLEGDYPVGPLIVSDIHQSNAEIVISVTNSGRVMAVDVRLPGLKWLSKIETISRAMFCVADVDADGKADVLLPGREQTLVALSGLDGSVIWESKEKMAEGVVLVCTKASDGRLFVTHIEPQGLRTIEVPRI
jgi:outer membrane protein assembly factor BamB